MDLGFKDKVILVAASSKGLGFGIAEALAKEGAALSLASRSQANIEAAAEKLRNDCKAKVRTYVVEASSSVSIDNWVSSSLKDFGRIDGLVVNAGGPPPGNFDALDDLAWEKAYNLTLMSAVRMIRAVLPELKKNKKGSILTITSSSVKEPIPSLLLSNVFRSGVASLVKSLSEELAANGIRINNLVPGRIKTERLEELDTFNAERAGKTFEDLVAQNERLIPLGRYGTTEEFAAAAAFLLSEQASYITGTSLVVDGGRIKAV